ncbi:MucBP domain-containing protein, partial [Clostridium thermobutyricum]|uniref:MucBP domain-containing protein n=1 Tax=Clostridium thermobutyricum TaxID=29372 RepID=UPI0029426E98
MNRKKIAVIIATATIVGGIYMNPVIAHADNINNVANIKVQEQNNSNITNNIDAYDQASYISLNNITFSSDKDISGKYLYVEVEGYGQVTVGEIKTTMIDGVKHYIVPKAENGNDIPVNKPLNVKFYIANSQFEKFDLSKCTLAYEMKGVEFHALDVFQIKVKSKLPEEYNGEDVYYSLNPLSTTSQVNEIKQLKQVKIAKDGTVNVYTNSQSAGNIYFYIKNKDGKFTRYFTQYIPGAVNYTIKKLDYYQNAGNGTYLTSKMPASFVCPENQAWVVMGNGMININLNPGKIPDSSKIKTTISIEGLDGKIIGTPESATGEPGNKTNLKIPQIPKGYHLVNITDNGKVITNVPSTFGDSDDNIIYHVEKNPTKTTISIEGSNGKAIGTPESATGEPGNKTNLKDPQIPEGYHLVNITDNGKVITNVPSTFGDSDNNIIYHVAKNPKITVKVVDSKGKELGKSITVNGDPNSNTGLKVPSIPKGYHLVNVTNGEGETVKGIPSTFGNKDEIIIYHVEKNPTKTTISIEGSNGKVIGTPKSETGEPGDKTNLKDPQIPKGYHLVNITDNGKVITNVPSTFGDSDNNIIYHVAKNPKITVKVVDSKGKELGKSITVNGDPNSNTGLKVPSIPKGYHLVNVTNGEGETVKGIPSTFGNKDEIIIYHVEKNPTKTTISIEGSNGKAIGTPESATGE